MAVKHPISDPHNQEDCRRALQPGFDLLVEDAEWAGWDAETVAHALVSVAMNYQQSVRRRHRQKTITDNYKTSERR